MTTNHLPISLQTKRAYLNTPNEIKESCFQEIVESVYGGGADILSLLISNASTSELKQMHQIIKQKNVKYQEKIKLKNKPKNKGSNKVQSDDNNLVKSKIRSLSELSRDSIVNICGYLDRIDIASFKLTSYTNGIICLYEMSKCNIGVFNTNELIDDKNKKFVDRLGNCLKEKNNFNYQRYSVNMSVLSLREIFEQKYAIPLSQQLILLIRNENKHAAYLLESNDSNLHDPLSTKSKFILFDKRNVVMFDEQNKNPKCMDKIGDWPNGKLIFVKWFDIYFQDIIPIQFIVGNDKQMTVCRLTKYIESEFIATTSEQKIWHSKLMSYFKKMNNIAPHHPKLIAYEERNNELKELSNPIKNLRSSIPCIFQLNTGHPIFTKHKFTTIHEKFKLLKQ